MSVSIFNSFHCDNDFSVRFTEAKMHQSIPRAKLAHVRAVDLPKKSLQLSASQKWGFDFARGCPLEDTELFLWERVPPTNEIPEMYALSRAAHIRPIDPDRTPSKKRRHTRRDSFEDLYDELTEQSNRYAGSNKNNVLDLSFEDVDGGHTSSSLCDEDSFEEDDNNMLCDLRWMPTTSKISSVESTKSNTNVDAITSMSKHVATRPICDTSCSDKPANSCSKSRANASISSGSRPLRISPRIREKRQYKITGCTVSGVRAGPCANTVGSEPCRFQFGQFATLEFDYTTEWHAEAVYAQYIMHGASTGNHFVLNDDLNSLPEGACACSHSTCPVRDSVPNSYSFTRALPPYITPDTYSVRWYLSDSHNPGNTVYRCCFTFTTQVV